MNKNNIIGFVLMALVLIAFSWYSTPSEEEIAAQQKQDSIAAAAQQKAQNDAKLAETTRKAEAQAAALADTTGLFYNALHEDSNAVKSIVLKNSKLQLTINSKGGTIAKAEILGFTDRNGASNVTLFDEKDQGLRFLLAGKSINIVTSDLYFTPENQTANSVTMVAKANNGGKVAIDYKLGKDYMLTMSLRTKGLAGIFAPNYKEIDVEWTEKCKQQERGHSFENRYAQLTYKETDGGTDYLNETKSYTDEPIEERLDWVAFKNQFFSATLISKDGFAANSLMTSVPLDKETHYLKEYGARLKTAFDPTGAKSTDFEMFIGPNDFRLLQDMNDETITDKDLDLQQLVYLGWPLFRIINRWFTIYVFDGLTSLGFNMGIVLILITLLLKAITFPLVKKSYMSSAKMRVLKPKLDEATKQYNKPEDQMMKQQAMMSLYSKYGVSPLNGCLPMLIQMPIWIAMFNFVPNAIQLRGQSFLWINDLSTYDPIVEWSSNLWLIGDHLSLTCILFCVSNVLYTIMSMRQQKDQMVGQQADQMKAMQWMMYIMPVMFFFIFNDYSAGLNFYYFVSLFFSAAIMWLLRKTTNDEKLLAILEARYKENEKNPKKMSGLAARLQAMQEQNEEMRKRREERFGKKF